MVNYIKAAIDLGRPVVKAVGEAFDALGNKIGALPDAITTYHGSPHDFDEFDMSKIGTGEGAQAYGHGLYFAENENVANIFAITDRLLSVRCSCHASPLPSR